MQRRHFAQTLAGATVLAPFLPLLASRGARAATGSAAPRRLVVVTSLGTDKALWTPASEVGKPLVLPQTLSPLAPVLAHTVLVDGLSFANPTEGHSSPQALTGFTFANGYGPSCTSVDQYVAARLGGAQRLPSLLLGWQANAESHFWAGGRRLATLDDPAAAWQSAFGGLTAPAGNAGAVAAGPAVAATARRRATWELVQKQAARMAAQLRGDERARLQRHVQAVATLLARGTGVGVAAGCTPPAQPDLAGADFAADASQGAVASGQAGLIAAALACDLTRVVGMQFGTSNRLFVGGGVNDDEHSAVHSGIDYQPKLIAAEQTIAAWVAQLVQQLAGTADPLAESGTLLDSTLVVWTRDIAHGPAHTQFSMPYAIFGGGTFLAKQPGGRYVNCGGDDASSTVGTPHQRLLLSLVDYMGAGAGQDFGTVAALPPDQRAPLAQLRG